MRTWLFVVLLCSACSPPPAAPAPKDPTTEAWYPQTVADLTALAHQANDLFQKGKADDAAAFIEKGEPLSAKLLAVRNPTLGAMEAASDLDQLYGQMLFSNHNYGWARLMFQKNAARWKSWTPQTPNTAARLKSAQTSIARCDTKILQ